MAGHYFYDPRPYYGFNMNTNLMPLDELFYKYEPVPYWMDQRMAPMAYPDYVHSGHVKQVMTRGPEVQQFHLPYTRPELAVRDDIYTDAYKRAGPHFGGFGQRGHSQDDAYLHTMTPAQYVHPQFPAPPGAVQHRGYGEMPMSMPMSMPKPMGYMPMPMHGHTNTQNFPNQRPNNNGGAQMDVTSKGTKNSAANNNNNNNKSYTSDDGYGNKSNRLKKLYNDDDDDDYTNKSSSNKSGSNKSKSKQEMYDDDYGYGNKTSKKVNSNDDGYSNMKSSNKSIGNKSKQESMYDDDYGYGNKTSKKMNGNDDGYSNMKSSNKSSSNKSKQESMYDDGYSYGNNKTSKKIHSNDDGYSSKSNYGMQGNTKQQQQRYTNGGSSSDSDEDEYVGSGKSGGKSSHGMGSKKSGKSTGSSEYHQTYGGNNMVVYGSAGKKQSGQKHGSQSKMGYQDSSSDEDESYAYTKKASKAGPHNLGVTKVQHSHGHGGKEQQSRGFDSHVQSYGQQPKHTQFHSLTKSVELKVPICCDNCERKVTACLEYVDGVESVLCDQWQKKVIVYGNVKPDVVLKRVRRVKKASELWQQAPKRISVY